MQDLFREVMHSLTRTNSNEAPITRTEWVLFGATVSAVVRKIDGNGGYWPSQRLPLDRVGREFAFSNYVRRWKQNSLKSGQEGRGVSIEGNELYVYTGARGGPNSLARLYIDVKSDIGPWNTEARKMIGELRDWVGEAPIWQLAGQATSYPRIAPAPLSKLVETTSKQELLRPDLPIRPTLPEAQLELARKLVNAGIHVGPRVR
jgi:hypothetical protein